MPNVRDAVDAIVDYNFGQPFSNIVAKSVGVRTYASRIDELNAMVVAAGLNPVERKLGGHPDFDHLTASATHEHPITTMFADLRNFTRYGLFLPRDVVRQVKYEILSSFIQIVHAFDGHVHNIPGDGLMVFFGGTDKDHSECGTQAMLAGASLLYALSDRINPLLEQRYGFDERIHMRVGLEHGDALWGEYGLGTVAEVKATGFSVDFAAKIQHAAATDTLRAGETLRDLVALPTDLYSDSREYRKQFRGLKASARHYQLDWKAFLRLVEQDNVDEGDLPIGVQQADADGPSFVNPRMAYVMNRALPSSVPYRARLKTRIAGLRQGPFREHYSGQRKLPKGWWLKFEVEHDVPGPVEIEWEVVNNGQEAYSVTGGPGHLNNEAYNRRVAYEHTGFRGTHYMVCSIKKDGREVVKAAQAVLVQ